MTTLLLVAWISLGQPWLASAQGPEPSIKGQILPASEGRIFDMPAAAAWPLVQRRLKELGLSTDKADRENQAALTKWRDVTAKGMEWLTGPTLPEGYVALSVRFLVFVSPFVEPARVYVGSMVEARDPQGFPATADNVPNTNQSLMAEIAKGLGAAGVPIPLDLEGRRRLVRWLLKDDSADCLGGLPPGGGVSPPRKIPLSEFKVIYPSGASRQGKEGEVRVEFTVREDGAVASIRLVDSPSGYRFEASAMGAASLLLYVPAKVGDCSIPTSMSYTLRFRQ